MGIYVQVLRVLGLVADLGLLAKEDLSSKSFADKPCKVVASNLR